MRTFLVIGALALDRPIRLDGPLRSGGRLRARSLDGGLEARLGGGAANAGCALRAAGHEVLAAAVVAGDADGRRAMSLAAAAGLDLSPTRVRPGASARTLVLVEPSGERTIIALDGAAPDGRPRLAPPPGDLSIRPAGVFVRSAYDGAADWARLSAGPVILHWPSPAYDGEADVVVASADDLPQDLAAAPYAAAAARLGPRLKWVVVTRGSAGADARRHRGGRRVRRRPAGGAGRGGGHRPGAGPRLRLGRGGGRLRQLGSGGRAGRKLPPLVGAGAVRRGACAGRVRRCRARPRRACRAG